MKLSTKTGYGLRACFILALHDGEIVPISDLVKCTTVTQKYLEKILALLAKDGILATKRGVNGGYRLAREAEAITVGEIFRCLEDNLEFSDCLSGVCDDEYCPNRDLMRHLYATINDSLDAYSLADFVKDNTCHS